MVYKREREISKKDGICTMNLFAMFFILQLLNDSLKGHECLNSEQKSAFDFRNKRPLTFPCRNDSHEVTIRKSLELWIAEVETSSLRPDDQGTIDKHDFQLDISLNMLKNNPHFDEVGVIIECEHREILFQGTMKLEQRQIAWTHTNIWNCYTQP